MSDTPPPPSGLPPPPPPPLPPGFGVDDEEDEFSDVSEEEMDVESEEEIVSELQDELPPPPPPGFDPLHRSFTGFDSSPPSPPEFDDADEEEEEVWDVDELDIQSFDDTLTSLEQMPEAEEDGVEEAEEEVEDWNAALDRAFVTEAEEDSKGSSEEVSQIALSSNLRPAAEVDSIPGDKLYVTLREKEESVLNPDGTVRQQSIDGELILRNSSRKDRAWDIEVLLQNTDSTDIGGGAITVRELDATQTTNLPYTASGPRMLILREHIDTEPERPQESSLSMIFSEHSQEILIRLSVENIAPVSLTDVVVRRALPENFELVDGPEYDIKDNELVWRIGRLPVGESASLEILPRVTTRTIQRFATGTVSAAYSCEATVSRAQFDSVNSRARQFGYVSPKEDDRPDVFHCKLVVENRSSFVVGLSGATVWLAGRSEPFLDMEDIREDIPPEGLWDSIEKRIEAIDKPNFTHEINYSILPRANVESTGILELKERSFKVLDAEVNKQYSISRIRSYVASDLDCITVVENT
ncbi:MAG: hypothetical protein VYE70_01775, partial [Candidatus Thermoplasmatota archaeon]|nr:hypothetical protein [Candidatus Thermoplasmatota archaeon]